MKLELGGINNRFGVGGGVTVIESTGGCVPCCNCEINCASEIEILKAIITIAMGKRNINFSIMRNGSLFCLGETQQ